MTWLKLWSSSTKDDTKSKEPSRTTEVIESVGQTLDTASTSIQRQANEVLHSNATATAFTQPQTILATVLLTTATLGIFRFYKTYLRRIPQAVNIHPNFLRRRSLVGRVTSVGDGDNFRIYHTPGGRLAGWGWFPGRRIPVDKKELKDQTIHVRLAGIDAPELAHFGRPAQPYGQEALEWLTSYVLGKRVRVYVYKADQYSRVVGSAYVWKGLWRRDISMQMLKVGLATVYEAKSGVEFGKGDEQKYRKAEWWAKTRRKGMWSGKNKDFESPRDYKNRHGVGNPQNEAKP